MRKNLILLLSFILTFSLILINAANAQLPSEYPFRSKIDGANNIYVTGYETVNGVNEILIQKIEPLGGGWVKTFASPYSSGNDKGMDVVIEPIWGDVFVAGYIYNSDKSCYDIILLKYNSAGTLQGTPFIYDIGLDNKALAMVMDDDQNIYLCGYTTSQNGDKDFITMKFYNNLVPAWEEPLIYDEYPGDDVATNIFADEYYVYVMGYSYQGTKYENDLLLVTYQKNSTFNSDYVLNNIGDEKPTSFIMAEKSLSNIVKSKFIGGGVAERWGSLNFHDDYFIYYIDGNLPVPLVWPYYFGSDYNDASTSIAKNNNGDIIATGYVYNGIMGYDFGTVRLDKTTGNNLWTKYYDMQENNISGDDKASSVVVSGSGNIYVTGYSQYAQGQYVTLMYTDNEMPVQEWVQEFEPVFNRIPGAATDFATESHIDADNNLIVVAMGWDVEYADYDVVKYDSAGNILFTMSVLQRGTGNDLELHSKSDKIKISGNYPNPFNPTTTIRYNLFQSGNIEIKLYNTLGQLVKNIFSGYQAQGYREQAVDASGLSSGIYYYTITGNDFNEVRKITLLK